jgi:hypothetical protein
MRSTATRRCLFLWSLVLAGVMAGCGGGGTREDSSTAPQVELVVSPSTMPYYTSYLRFVWTSQNATVVVESNFGAQTTSGTVTRLISLQPTPDRTARFHLTVRSAEGVAASATVQLPVGSETPVNTAPFARFAHDPLAGTPATTFHFDASGSWDGQDAAADLEVRWDFDGDGVFDTPYSKTKAADHVYTQAELRPELIVPTDPHGSIRQYVLPVMLQVRDAGGLIGFLIGRVQVTVGAES